MRRLRSLAPLLALAGLGLFAASAGATFPGENGRIAFTWSVGGEAFEEGPAPRLVGVVSVRPDGSGRRLVARRGTRPRFSPGGGRLAFLRAGGLWVARADGRGARRLTPSGWRVGDQEWSPGGARLAFVRDFRAGGSAIYAVRPDGSGLRRLVKASQLLSVGSGAWSPGGRALVYEHHSARTLVRVIRSGAARTLARRSGEPTWSARGVIAYTTGSQVCLRRPRAEAPHRCFAFPDASASNPGWSPDGRRLMFLHQGPGPAEIRIVRPDGTVLSRAPRPNVFPILSPDGSRLAFSQSRTADGLAFQDLFTIRPDGSGERRLVRGGQAVGPDWQAVGRAAVP